MSDLVRIFKNTKEHVMNGVSYMIPVVATGGIMIGLGVLLGNNAGAPVEGTFAYTIYSIGQLAISMMSCVIAAYVGFSIADRAAVVPGIIAGMVAQNCGAGFLGGLIAGFLNGIFITYLKKIKLHKNLRSLQSIIFIPLVTTLVTSLIIQYGLGGILASFNTILTNFFLTLDTTQILLYCALTGPINILDYGLFISKAGTVVTMSLLSQIDPVTGLPPASVMIILAAGLGNMAIPPLVAGVATLIKRDKFTEEDRATGISAIVLGLCGISEGAIPFAMKDYLRVTLSSAVGCVVFNILSVLFQCQTIVFWSGPICATGMSIGMALKYFLAMAVAAIIGGTIYAYVKKPLSQEETAKEVDVKEVANGDVIELKF